MLSIGYCEDQAVERSEYALANILPDGTRVTVRPVRESDVMLIWAMHMRLSKESVYFRYLARYMPDPEDLKHLCFLDGRPGLALVATVQEPQEKVIAMACYCVDPRHPTTAEAAFLVEDCYQGRGLGKRMLLALCQHARQMGLEILACFIHPENCRMLRLIKGCGLRSDSVYSQGLQEARVWLKAA